LNKLAGTVAVRLFPRKSRQARDAAPTEFMATVMAAPAGGDTVVLEGRGIDRARWDMLAPDSMPPDSLPPDSRILDSQPPDSLPPEDGPTLKSLPAPLDPAAVAHASNDQAGGRARHTYIGRYEVRSRLGSGGLGQVFEAWDPLLSRTVAIKTLQFDASATERATLDRLLLDEARAVARLSHPHIVTLYDAGLSQHGVWIAMERLQGRDLRDALAGGWRPSPARAAQLVRRVADALAYAHAHGVVHCDVKPANIYLTERGKPKVLDFGIARLVQENGAVGDLPSSFGGSVAGSPHHLAPEQWAHGTIDARTDIYALGTVFYELLAGRKAFVGDNVEQIRNAVESGHPAPPHELRPDVPPALAAIAMRAMARRAEDRYATAQELAQALRRWLEQHQPGTPASEPASRASTQAATGGRVEPGAAPRAGRGWIWALAAVLLALGALLAWRGGSGGAAPAAAQPSAAINSATAATSSAAVVTARVAPAPADAASAPAQPGATSYEATAAPPAARPGTVPPRARTAAAPVPAAAVPVDSGATGAAAPASGVLHLAISPWGEVEVNGQPRGTTPPLTSLELPAGRHLVTVRNADFPAHSVTVQVAADQPVTVRHRFAATP
jgi:serine/threonine-protein kinase